MRAALLLLLAGLAAGIGVRKKTEHLETNRIPNDPPPPPKPFPYKYVSVCVNETDPGQLLLEIDTSKCAVQSLQVAVGRYSNQVNQTGWGILEIETFPGYEYDVQAYAAGVAEGYLTKLQIYYHYRNTIEDLCTGYKNYCKTLYNYLTEHLDWIRKEVIAQPASDPYWRHVNLTFAQMTGIYDAYVNRTLNPEIGFDLHAIYMIQLSGELFDLNKKFNKTPDPQEYPEAGRCSGLVKIADNNKDMFFSHVAMSGLNTMNRILKLYKFAYDKKEVPGHTVSFSGYPAALASADDYSIMSSGLSSIETTIAIFNQTLYDQFVNSSGQLHCWVRSFISNALASTSKQWVEIFQQYNSGTYNNQWTVLDWKKFTPGKELPDSDVLWVLEQAPGFTSIADVTWFLKKWSYWPSYNIPYLTDINIISGFSNKGNQFDWYRWGSSPRAHMFERDHHKVQDIDSLTKLMRYNDYEHDEFAKCKCNPTPYTAEGGISARGDLNPLNNTWEVDSMSFRNHAGLDYKGCNYEMASKLTFRAWGGPTNDQQPTFDWRTTKVVAPHYGQPDVWNFTAVDLIWESKLPVYFGVTRALLWK
ncbi:unnamed protein product, partial [Mesorhabditis spiculigera]